MALLPLPIKHNNLLFRKTLIRSGKYFTKLRAIGNTQIFCKTNRVFYFENMYTYRTKFVCQTDRRQAVQSLVLGLGTTGTSTRLGPTSGTDRVSARIRERPP